MKISSLFLALCATCFFPEHIVVANPSTKGASPRLVAALRKKATPQFQYQTVFARSTSFSHDEDGRDHNSAKFESITSVPLRYPDNGKIGSVSVSNIHGVNFGDLVITPDGQCFLAVDYGSDVESKKASRVLAEKMEIDDPKYSEAPVLDFFVRNEKQVGNYWDHFIVVKSPVPYLKLSVKERVKRYDPEAWRPILEQFGLIDEFKLAAR